jgi:hypothetical protein
MRLGEIFRLDKQASWLVRQVGVFRLLNLQSDEYDRQLASLPKISGPALVVGSAPRPTVPKKVDNNWFRISVNSSQVVLDEFGLAPPNLTIFMPKIRKEDKFRKAYWDALRGRSTDHLIFSVGKTNDGGHQDFIAEKHYKANTISFLTQTTKAAIVTEIANRYMISVFGARRQVSNGIFATFLALKLGANKVVMSGFSLNDGWYHTKQLVGQRNHVAADLMACKALVDRRLPVFASDPVFAERTGLPLWNG